MSLAIYFGGVMIVVLVMISSYFLGERSINPRKSTPYEGGIIGTGSSRVRFFAHYFLVAILFVVFDMESVFLYVWASSVRELGWLGFIEISIFIGMLALSLIYVFSLGVLSLAPKPRMPPEVRHE